jgi:carboxyl-terminal processing protease
MGRNRAVRNSPFVVLVLALVVSQLAITRVARAVHDDSTPVSTATVEGRLAVFDDAWETIQDRYYDPKFHGIDWQAKRTTFRPVAARAGNTQEFYDVLRQMIASLRDAHTRVYSPDEKFDWWSPRFVTVGLAVREVEGAPTVIQVEAGTAASRTDIKQGDVIVSVDDVPVAQFVAQRMRNFGLVDEGNIRHRVIANLFEGPAGTNVRVRWVTRDGKQKSTVLQRYWSQRNLGFNNQRKGKIAILRLDAFTQTVAIDFSKNLPSVIDGAEGIILDLRFNGGGDAEAMADVASLFLDEGINLGRFADRSGAAFELQTFPKRIWRSPAAAAPIKLPMVVLTSENTSSAAEILAAALQTKGRAQVVGSTTCGCVLAIRNRHALPDGGVLDVSEFDYKTAGGVRLEGAGVKPDTVIPVTRSDVYSRHDRAFERAINLLD